MKKYEIEDDKILNKAKYDREQKRDRMREQVQNINIIKIVHCLALNEKIKMERSS